MNLWLDCLDRNFKSDLCSICFSSPSVLDGVNAKQNPALSTARLFGMSCGHMFCLECWRAFFDVRISSSHVSVVECMAAKCNIRIPDDFIFAILNSPESVQKHRRHILNEVIEVTSYLYGSHILHIMSIVFAPAISQWFCSKPTQCILRTLKALVSMCSHCCLGLH